MSTKGQIVIPAPFRQEDGIHPGDEFDFERVSKGCYRLALRRRPNEGLVDLLLACPVKGTIEPLESESTETLGVSL